MTQMSLHEAQQKPQRTRQRATLFDGRLICNQFKPGYRFSIDSVLLAHFTMVRKNEKILDLGTGCGVIGLILCYRYGEKNIFITGIENQPELAELAQENIRSNGYDSRFKLIVSDIRTYRDKLKPEAFSQVISNPPFFAKGSGRTSADLEARMARHQDGSGPDLFIQAAAYSVKNRGKVSLIYPSDQVSELIICLQKNHLVVKKLQFIHSYPEQTSGAKLVLVEACKNGGLGTNVLPPLFIYQYKNGPYSDAVQAMFRP